MEEPPLKRRKLNSAVGSTVVEKDGNSQTSLEKALEAFVESCEENIPSLGLLKNKSNKSFQFITAPASGEHIGLASLLRKTLARKFYLQLKKTQAAVPEEIATNETKIENKLLRKLLKRAVADCLLDVPNYICESHYHGKIFYCELELEIRPCFAWQPSEKENQTTKIKLIFDYDSSYLARSGICDYESNLSVKFGVTSRTLARYFTIRKKNSRNEAIYPLFELQYGYDEDLLGIALIGSCVQREL